VAVPSPAKAAALRSLGLLRTDEIPMLAAHWLVEYDSPALRRLAGLDTTDGWLIDRMWPEVLADLRVEVIRGEQAWDLAFSFQLAAWRAGERSLSEVMSVAIRAYIESDYPEYPPEAGWLYGLDDELQGDWGRGPDVVLADVQQVLTGWEERLAFKL